MKSLLLATLAILTASPAHAGPFGLFGRHRSKVVIRQSWRGAAVACPCAAPAAAPFARPPAVLPSPQGCPGGVCPVPQAPAKVVPAYGPSFVPIGYQDGPGAALAAINAVRAMHGRPALGWDATLAAFAASNGGVHAPGSSGGGAQAWAGVGSYTQAVRMWSSSPAHLAIMLGAVQSVGCSTCGTGITGNFR